MKETNVKQTLFLFLMTGVVAMGQAVPVPPVPPVAPTVPAPPAPPSLNAFQVFTGNGQDRVVYLGSSRANVKGKPFSATEENRLLQVLGNGAKIESNTVAKLYRDAEGRTRTEDAQGKITIVDPVAGFRATLNSKTKTGTKANSTGGGAFANVQTRIETTRVGQTGSELKERMGLQPVNGVQARGERLTITIPKGDIGNDRELKVVTERWTSEDLQMLVKSVNSDPRYGETTYELKGISTAAPDPKLFEIPADYTVTSGGARGAVAVRPTQARPAAGRSGKK
jgi:hypothetical protein